MGLCPQFECNRRDVCLHDRKGCEQGCMIALDIYKCHACIIGKVCPNYSLKYNFANSVASRNYSQ